ncbi:MAG: hypothetical protein WD898_00945 [Candidatus Paceibacterota bacterium]
MEEMTASDYWLKRRSLKRRLIYQVRQISISLALFVVALVIIYFWPKEIFDGMGTLFNIIVVLVIGYGLIMSSKRLFELVDYHEYVLDRRNFRESLASGDRPWFAPIYNGSTDPEDLVQCGKVRKTLESLSRTTKDLNLVPFDGLNG